MTRIRWVLAGLVLLGAVTVPGASGAQPRNAADSFLDDARAALRHYEFQGAVELTWQSGGRQKTERIDVTAADGAVRLADGRVLATDGRAWIRTDGGWQALGGAGHDLPAPPLSGKYRARIAPGPEVVGRPTRLLVISRDGKVIERVAADRETGIVLARVQRDPWAGRRRSMRFVTLSALRPRQGRLDPPSMSGAPVAVAPPQDSAATLGAGFERVDARALDADTVQVRYSDGVFDASVTTRDGSPDWDALPRGGDDVRLAGVRARRYSTAAGAVIVWESNRRTITCVTDAPRRDQSAIVRTLSRDDDGAWTTMVRFVGAPFRWL